MIVRRLRRLAPALLAGVVALAASGCGSTLNDAVTLTFREGGATRTIHITRRALYDEVGELAASGKFRQFIKENGFASTDSTETAPTKFVTDYLERLINLAPYHFEFVRLRLQVSAADRVSAQKDAEKFFALRSEFQRDASGQAVLDANGQPNFVGPGAVYASLPKSLRDTLVERFAERRSLGAYFAAPTAAKVREFFDQFRDVICPSNRLVSHIVVRDAVTANSVLDQLKRGVSFAQLARAKSVDTQTAQQGGAAGCFVHNAFPPGEESVVASAPLGVPTGPVSVSGFQLIVLVTPLTFDALSPQIAQAMQSGTTTASVLASTMKVRIHDPRLGSAQVVTDSSGSRCGIVPPLVSKPREQREAPNVKTTTSTTVPCGR